MAEEQGTGGWLKVADAKYVRLREGVDIVADLDSGWSVSGEDVVEAPNEEEDPEAHSFVRTKLREGILEPASRAEFEEVQKHEGDGTVPQQVAVVQTQHQEADVITNARKARQKVQAKRRGGGEPVGDAFRDDEARRAEAERQLRIQREAESGGEDEEAGTSEGEEETGRQQTQRRRQR